MNYVRDARKRMHWSIHEGVQFRIVSDETDGLAVTLDDKETGRTPVCWLVTLGNNLGSPGGVESPFQPVPGTEEGFGGRPRF